MSIRKRAEVRHLRPAMKIKMSSATIFIEVMGIRKLSEIKTWKFNARYLPAVRCRVASKVLGILMMERSMKRSTNQVLIASTI